MATDNTQLNSEKVPHLRGRVDDLVIYQTNRPTFGNQEGEYVVPEIYNDFFLQNEFTNLIVNGVNPSGNDNVFWWSFDNQLGQSWEPRDSSTIPNSDIEPPNGNAFHLMMQTEDFGIQQVTSSTVSEFYSNSNQ